MNASIWHKIDPVKLVTIAVVVLVLGHAPLIWLATATPLLSAELARCGRDAASIMINNPLERLVTRMFVVEATGEDTLLIRDYTLFGIPVSKFAADCQSGSAQRL